MKNAEIPKMQIVKKKEIRYNMKHREQYWCILCFNYY